MDLLLVRCADLETDRPAPDDPPGAGGDAAGFRDSMDAGLSVRGERNSRRLAAWLRSHGPRQLQVFCSPAKGARQMAELLLEGLAEQPAAPRVSRLLGPSALASDLLGAVGWPHDHSAALVVAHQPALGVLASLLLTGHEAPMAFKKGAVWWFSNRNRGGELQTVLRCALTPDLLKGGGRNGKSDGEAIVPPTGFSLDLPDVVDMVRMRLSGAVR